MKSKVELAALLTALALALAFSRSLQAQHQWTDNFSGDWFDLDNWAGGEVPGPGSGPLTNVQINTLASNPAVIDGQAGDSGHLLAGFNASGSLTIANAGSLVSSSATIGYSGTADGIVRVTGAGSYTADLQGGAVAVTLVPGQPPAEGLHPILTADGGISGQFDDVAPGSGGFALVRIGDTVYVDVSDGLFSDRYDRELGACRAWRGAGRS